MKTIKTTILGLGLLSIISFVSCNEDKSQEDFFENVPYNSIEEFFEANEIKAQNFTLDATVGGVITGKDGTEITFEGNSFVDAGGNVVTGTVNITLKEIFKASDMVLSNKPTNAISDSGENTFLISEGETEVQATKEGKKLRMAKGKNLTISVPASGKQDDSMRAFVGNPNGVKGPNGNTVGAGTMVWTPAKPIVRFSAGSETSTAGRRYIYDAFQLGWRNCDKFYRYTGEKTTNSVDLSNSPKKEETMLFIIFQDNNRPSVVRYTTSYAKGLKSYENMIPVGLEVTYVAISITDNKQYIATKKHTMGKNDEVVLDFKLTTSKEIKETLERLN